jgi:hypothetical protein
MRTPVRVLASGRPQPMSPVGALTNVVIFHAVGIQVSSMDRPGNRFWRALGFCALGRTSGVTKADSEMCKNGQSNKALPAHVGIAVLEGDAE